MYNFDRFQAAEILQVQIFRAEQSKKKNRKRKKGTKLFWLLSTYFTTKQENWLCIIIIESK